MATAAEPSAPLVPTPSPADPVAEFWRAPFAATPHVELVLPPSDQGDEPQEILLDAAEREIAQKNPARALELLARIEEPTERSLSATAAVHFLNGDLARAAEMFDRLTREQPLVAEYFVASAQMSFLLGNYPKALATLELSRATHPADAHALQWVALTRARLGDWPQCVVALREATQQEPSSVKTRLWLAHALRLAGRPEEARRELQSLLQFAPDQAQAYLSLALLSAERGDAETATELLRRGRVPLAQHPDAETILRGPLFAELRKDASFEKALADLRAALPVLLAAHPKSQAPPPPEAHGAPKQSFSTEANPPLSSAAVAAKEMGDAAAKAGKWEEAITFYESALTVETHHGSLLARLGECYLATGEYGRAASLLERARAHDSGSGEIYYALGKAYEGLGWRGLAVETWKKGLVVAPHHKGMQTALAAAAQ